MDLYDELRRITAALNAARIGYALAGGLAVSIYATPRATEDVDLLIAESDVDAAVTVLNGLGFRAAGPAMDVARGRLRIQRLIKIEGADLVPVDLLIPGDPALARWLDDRTRLEYRGEPTMVVSLSGLRALKRLRGSAQDRADLEALGPES
jgi:hypothetical protein